MGVQVTMMKEIKGLVKKAGKLILLFMALIYIVSPIDILPLNPIDDIIVGIIAFLIVFTDWDITEKLFGALEIKKSFKK